MLLVYHLYFCQLFGEELIQLAGLPQFWLIDYILELFYLIFAGLPLQISLRNMLTFLEFLAQQNLSPKVIRNYMSSVITMAKVYHLQHIDTSHVLIAKFFSYSVHQFNICSYSQRYF